MCKWKRTKNLTTAKTTAMQNTEGWERHREWLRGKDKGTNHYKVQYDVQARTGTKRCSAKIG